MGLLCYFDVGTYADMTVKDLLEILSGGLCSTHNKSMDNGCFLTTSDTLAKFVTTEIIQAVNLFAF